MSATFTRSALEYWGRGTLPLGLPQDVAYVVCGNEGRRVVTYADLRAQRKTEQKERLARIRQAASPWRAWRVRVANFVRDGELFSGTQAMIERIDEGHWIDRDYRSLKEKLMRLFPLVLLNDFAHWKCEFARQFKRRSLNGYPVGVAYLWWTGNSWDDPRLNAT